MSALEYVVIARDGTRETREPEVGTAYYGVVGNHVMDGYESPRSIYQGDGQFAYETTRDYDRESWSEPYDMRGYDGITEA
jgi:hypothetical protein